MTSYKFKLDKYEKERYEHAGWTICIRPEAVYIVSKFDNKTAHVTKIKSSVSPDVEYTSKVI